MIAHLQGTLISKSPVAVVVDVRGVGYLVHAPLSTYYALPAEGGEVTLKIHTHVREDAIKLYGFLTGEELVIFEKLIGISKVGPRLALSILSGMPPGELVTAVMNNDVARLATIPGIGRKTAERLTLEMRNKFQDLADGIAHPAGKETNAVLDDALSALVNLGYRRPEAEKALNALWEERGGGVMLEQLIKESLNRLS